MPGFRCHNCGYDLRGVFTHEVNIVRCSECGRKVTRKQASKEDEEFDPSWGWWLLAIAPLVIAIVLGSHPEPNLGGAEYRIVDRLVLGVVLIAPVYFFVLGLHAFRHETESHKRYIGAFWTALCLSLIEGIILSLFLPAVGEA